MKKQSKTGIASLVVMLFAVVFTSCKKNQSLSDSAKPLGFSINGKLPSFTPTPSLIAYWPFNGNANDYSGNGNNGTPNNVTPIADRFGNANSAYHFDGSTSYISVADNSALRLNGTDFTINAWVKLDDYNASYGSEVVDKRLSGPNMGYTFSVSGYANTAAPLGSFSLSGTSTTTLDTTQWHMITVVYVAASQQIILYKDGVYDNTTSSVTSPAAINTAILYIGCDNPLVSSPGYFFKGAMDDISIYSSALTSTNVSGLYNAPDLKSGLIAYWPLDNNGNDLSGNGNTGTLNSVTAVTDRFGNANSAYHFDGSTSYISVADNSALRLNGTDFTINAWVKLDDYNASYGSEVVDKRFSGPNMGYTFSISGYANTAAPLGSFSLSGTSTATLDTTQWHMITVVYVASSQQILLYKDGIYDNTTSSVTSPVSTNTATLYLGCDNPLVSSPGYFLKGAMDEVRIYGRALNSTSITALANGAY
ncbi:MAG: LamG domain-containing protein [Mucilaginibacter sp.]|uniref:LamG domain-containing protein n=1 Tax=Mucilaginibacter sp. TaxID=1882438 RepID=UPI003266DA58